jgi:uncharacterized paraquat-inducible protein A
MKRYTHGKCTRCHIVLRWSGYPRLSEAQCPRCCAPLERTAARLVKAMPVVDEHPLAPPRELAKLLRF